MAEQAGLTVVTWNAQGSQGLDIPAVADALGAFVPDVVMLQEVQRRQLGALRAAMQALDARWRFKHWGVTVPAEGLGLLSALPVNEVHTQVLAHRWQFWNWRRRIAVHIAVGVGGRTVRLVDVHLGAGVTTAERVRQVDDLLQHTRGVTLIGGDLNAAPGSDELGRFETHGWVSADRLLRAPAGGDGAPREFAPTNWPPGPRVGAPSQRLDYVLVRGAGVEVLDTFVPDDWERWSTLSDHLPVVARLVVT